MAREQTIFVRVKADAASFITNMKHVDQSLRTVDKSFKEYGSTVDEQRAKTNALRDSYRELGTTLTVAGAAIVGALGLMAAKYSQFDKAISTFNAHAGASEDQLAKLGDIAMETGHKYGISALEAVEAATNLAKAGISVEDVLGGGLEGALTLAATGNLNVADSAETAAIAMTQFGLSGRDVPHIADLMAAAAGKAVGEVGDMAWALRQAGLVANGMGLSIEETTGTLASFAQAGLIGSDAGTSFKSMLLAIQAPSGVAAKKMNELGLNFYDANGNFIGVAESAQMLQDRLWHLTQEQRNQALATIFGQDAIRSASILYEQGAEGINHWVTAVNDSGYASELAQAKLDNLQGDLQKLGVSFENLIFSNGSGFNDFLRGAVQALDSFLQMVNKIPEPVFNIGIALAGLTAAGALGVGGFMKLAIGAADLKDAFTTLGISADGTKKKLSGMGRVVGVLGKLGAAATGIAFLAASMGAIAVQSAPAAASLADIGNALADTRKGLGPLNDAFRNAEWANGNMDSKLMGTVEGINTVGDAVTKLQNLTANEKFSKWGNQFMLEGKDPLNQMAEQIRNVDDSLVNMVQSGNAEAAAAQFRGIVRSIEAAGGNVDEARSQFSGYSDAIRDYATSLGVNLTDQQLFNAMMGELPPALIDAAGGAEEAAAGISGMGEAASDAAMELEDVLDAMFQLGLINLSARQATSEYSEALRELGDAHTEIAEAGGALGRVLNDTGTDFDLATEAGKLANDALQNFASSGMDMVKANAQVDSSFDAVRGNLKKTYEDLVAQAEGWNIPTEAAQDLAREMLGVPDSVNIDTWMDEEAMKVAKSTGAEVDEIPDQKRVRIDTNAEPAIVELEAVAHALDSVPQDKEIRTLVTDNGTIDVVEQGIDSLTGKRVVAQVTDDGTVSDTQYLVDTIDGKTVLTPVSDNGTILTTQGAILGMYGKTLQTIVTDEGTISLTQQEVNNMAGRIIETRVTDSGTIMVVQGGIDGMQDGDATIFVGENGVATVQSGINNIQGKTVYVDVIQRYSSIGEHVGTSRGALKPGLATGGRLPTTGPGTDTTDGILGVNEYGMPHVRVDAGEWIINSRSSDKYNGLLAAINRDDPKLRNLPGFATGGRIFGLSARPGEENWQWQARQNEVIKSLEYTVGKLADWELHEDGSGWVRTMDGAMVEIADTVYTVTYAAGDATKSLGLAAQDAHWASETAKAAGGSFQSAGVAANATAGTFKVVGEVTQQAVKAILGATAAVNSAGKQRKAAQGGGLAARPGEANVVWRGRHDQFEQAISKKYGGIKYSDLHEDGSGQIVLDDGRLIELDNGRWKFVSRFKYGPPARGRTLSRYATGGRLPLTGPGTDKQDGFLGISALTGEPAVKLDAGEWIINARRSQEYHGILAAINNGTYLKDLPRHATGTRLDHSAVGSNYTPRSVYSEGRQVAAVLDPAPIAQAVNTAMSQWQPIVDIGGKKFYGTMKKAEHEAKRR